MIVNGWWQIFMFGAMGPVIVEFIKIFQMAQRNRPILKKYGRWEYWLLMLAILPVCGLIACATTGTQKVPLLVVLQSGANPSLLLGAYASGTPKSRSSGLLPQPEGTTVWELLSWNGE